MEAVKRMRYSDGSLLQMEDNRTSKYIKKEGKNTHIMRLFGAVVL